MSGVAGAPTARQVPRPTATVALAWLAMVGVDLLLHAGLLAPLYDWDSPFLLPPGEAFVRIPLGYLGLLLLAAGTAWLLPRLGVAGGRDGARIAGAVGAVGGAAFLLGLWSISTAEPGLLVGWWVGQVVELGLAGFVVGAVMGGTRMRVLAGMVAALFVVAAVATVVLQAIGYATPPVLAR